MPNLINVFLSQPGTGSKFLLAIKPLPSVNFAAKERR
jgi:hypothetical protein